MGNSVQPPELFKNYEHKSGKRLIEAIKLNERCATQDAIDSAKKEFTKPISKLISNTSDYDEMMTKMDRYLKKQYDIGDGVLFTKSPLEYCESIGSLEAAAVINENIKKMSQIALSNGKIGGVQINASSSPPIGIESDTVGTVTHDRAMLAKSRLIAFQDTRK